MDNKDCAQLFLGEWNFSRLNKENIFLNTYVKVLILIIQPWHHKQSGTKPNLVAKILAT